MEDEVHPDADLLGGSSSGSTSGSTNLRLNKLRKAEIVAGLGRVPGRQSLDALAVARTCLPPSQYPVDYPAACPTGAPRIYTGQAGEQGVWRAKRENCELCHSHLFSFYTAKWVVAGWISVESHLSCSPEAATTARQR